MKGDHPREAVSEVMDAEKPDSDLKSPRNIISYMERKFGNWWFCRIKQLKESFAASAGLESDYLAQTVLELWIAGGRGRGAAGVIEVQGISSPGGNSLVGESWIASP